MTKYKISVSFDEKNFFWIVVDKQRFIRAPTKEDLMGAKIKSYNKTNICDRCKEEKDRNGVELMDKSILYPGNAIKEKDKNGNWIRRFDCRNCYMIDYNKEYKNYENILKPLAGRRTGNLNDHRNIFADNCQELTHIWIGVEDLNKKNDNYNSFYDHDAIPKHIYVILGNELIDLYGKIPQTKGSLLINMGNYANTNETIMYYKGWSFYVHREINKIFDVIICYCANKDGDLIDRIYIIPKKEIIIRTAIRITRNPSRGPQWYEQYIVQDENILIKVNEIWRKLIQK